MNLNNITNTGTWGEQVTSLNQNFNRVGTGIDSLSGAYDDLQEAYANLQEAYEDLSKNAPEPMTAADWAALSADTSNLEEGKIYRVAGTNSYTDYMWNGTAIITMATFNNSMDSTPTKNSLNLVTSGGVYLKQIILSNPISDITTIL